MLCFIVLLSFLPFQILARPSYQEAQRILEEAPENILRVVENAPQIYEFPSRFDNEDSVSFKGQTFRQVLINDLKSFINSLKRGAYPGSVVDLERTLNSYFKFRSDGSLRGEGFINGNSRHRLTFKDLQGERRFPSEGLNYNSIQFPAKNLVDKIAGNDNPLRHGALKGWQEFDLMSIDADRQQDTFAEPEDLLQAIFKRLAINATSGSSFTVPNGNLEVQRIDKAYITKEGVDLAEIVHKFLQSSVSFSQASGDYLSTDLSPQKGLHADNEQPYKGSANYTALEHYWDEAFGYFGAARDFSTYNDQEIMKKLSKDSNGDGTISILTEKNHSGATKNSSRMDWIAQTYGEGGLDLSGELIDAFTKGRELIRQRPNGYRDYVEAYASIAIGAWEKTFAAVAIHYLNSTIKMIDSYGTEDYLFTMYAKFWSEMKGFSLAFQFNPTSQLSVDQFESFHRLIGDKPVLMTDGPAVEYKEDLLIARRILQKAFRFSDANVEVF